MSRTNPPRRRSPLTAPRRPRRRERRQQANDAAVGLHDHLGHRCRRAEVAVDLERDVRVGPARRVRRQQADVRAGGEHALERLEGAVTVAEPRPHERRPRPAPRAVRRAVGQPMLQRLGDRCDQGRIAVDDQLVVGEGAEQVGEVAVSRLPLDDLVAPLHQPAVAADRRRRQLRPRRGDLVEPRIVEPSTAAASTQRSNSARVICTSIAGFRQSATRTPSSR